MRKGLQNRAPLERVPRADDCGGRRKAVMLHAWLRATRYGDAMRRPLAGDPFAWPRAAFVVADGSGVGQ